MDKPVIGIRQADGSFYAIMDDTLPGGHKRVLLSAARTDQSGVKIELFRSTNGTMEGAVSLGSIPLSDPELGHEDIELTLDLDDGVLQASAAVDGQPPQTLSVDLGPFQSPRGDASILADPALAEAELDNLDDLDNLDFTEVDPVLPDLDAPAPPSEASDDPEFDLDDLEFPEIDSETVAAELPDTAEAPDLDDLLGDQAGAAQESFDLSDFDAGFGEVEPETPSAPPALDTPAETGETEEWEKISLDDLESMEFMDTGDEISAPSTPAPKAAQTIEADSEPEPDFRMDEDQSFELGDLDDLGDLPGLDDLNDTSPDQASTDLPDLDPPSFDAPALETPVFDAPELGSLDRDFMDLESTEPAWTPPVAAPAPEAPAKKPKASKARHTPTKSSEPNLGGLDKTALVLSLSALSLLVLLILVLLFLNMVKAPMVPVIQPEVMQWKTLPSMASRRDEPRVIDLGASAPGFGASTVLEVPQALKAARVSLRLGPGETLQDATDRFGPPARVEGDLLLW